MSLKVRRVEKAEQIFLQIGWSGTTRTGEELAGERLCNTTRERL